MKVPARVSFVTFAVRDMARMQRFYRQFGWPESKFTDDTFAAFQCGGAVLGLYGTENYKQHGDPPLPGAFKGSIVSINCRDAAEVDRVYEVIRAFDGIRIHGAPHDMSFGGRSFEWSDPEDNLWEVTWADETSFDERGGLIFP